MEPIYGWLLAQQRIPRFESQIDTPKPILTIENEVDIVVVWGAVTGSVEVSIYLVALYDDEDIVEEEKYVSTKVLTTRFIGFEPNKRYTVVVIAEGTDYISESEEGIASITTDKIMLPSPTSNQITLSATTNSVRVDWAGVATGNGSRVTTYTLSVELDDSTVGTIEVSALQTGSTVFSNLRPASQYTVRVIAQGDSTRYLNSNAYTDMITTAKILLMAPEIVSVTATNNSVTIEWSSVSGAGGYKASIYEGSSTNGQIQGMQTLTTAETSHTFEGLEPGTAYTVGVVATAENFYRASEERTASTTTAVQRLLAPTSIKITLPTANSVTVDWMGVTLQAGASTYALSIVSTVDKTISEEPVDIDAATGTHTFTGLMPNTEYAVTVVVKGDNRYSDSQSSIVKGTTAKLPGLRLRLRVFLEGPLQRFLGGEF